MELALALGFNTVAALDKEMSVEELEDWYAYRHKRLLPHRRFEYYLAQLTLHVSIVARLQGGPEYRLQDFLFDETVKPKGDTVESGLAAINALAGGVKVIRLGQKKKA